MPNLTMLDMGDKFRSLEVLLAAAMEMDCRNDDEYEIAFELVDKALMRCRSLRRELDGLEGKNA
ncbi:hypothetical protein HUZ88_20595 [Citrobacter portucalensis]|uniref:hypothetical protein n=1 Tax=Citrobacter portucalensis TaxID=1639133 RepID=UPI001EF8340A|nr:hypothetical protein [Citrobacter portucalensis]ULK55272.1 hypothetical protein HUZ88_20595 [Citrobacter portucalensis]